ncbi:MAG: response regulator [Deltaproteobacteria bacterium]|nr:response regulator [Deltaproteobacteria bacterium]
MTLKVLTVDDSKTIRMIVKKAFQAYNCEITEAENGVEGLAAAAKIKPGLIILDITMPVMTGVEMLERLKGDDALKAIPVIMLTAESGKDNVMNIVKKGINDYMVKPFKGEDLIERVRKIMPLEPKTEEMDDKKPGKYFTQVEDVVVLTLPAKVLRPVSVEVENSLQVKIKDMTAAQLKKMILDMGGVSETNVSLIKLIITALQQCQKANVAVKLVANAKQGEELKGFQETSQITVAHSIEEARAAM